LVETFFGVHEDAIPFFEKVSESDFGLLMGKTVI